MIRVARRSLRNSASATPATTRGGGNDWPRSTMPRSTGCTLRLSRRPRTTASSGSLLPSPKECWPNWLRSLRRSTTRRPGPSPTKMRSSTQPDFVTLRRPGRSVETSSTGWWRVTGAPGRSVATLRWSSIRSSQPSDTAVARAHRGHRLGMLLKIDMMRWLADEQPQLETIETWNNVDNRYMINVNEAIGYRLSRVYNSYELKLDEAAGYGANQKVVQPAVS